METFERLQLAGLALICLKNETKADVQRDLRNLTPMPIELVGERGFEPPTSRSQFTGSAKN